MNTESQQCITCGATFAGSFTGECPTCDLNAIDKFVAQPQRIEDEAYNELARSTPREARSPFSQRSEQQEWTSEMVNATLKDRPFAASTIASKHNAELTAERQRRQEAQADTEKYRSNCIFWGLMIIANANGGDWESASKDWQIAAAKLVRKPLVDALTEIAEDKLRQGDAIWMRDTAIDALAKVKE